VRRPWKDQRMEKKSGEIGRRKGKGSGEWKGRVRKERGGGWVKEKILRKKR
jgi:hypothetical protein